MIFEIIRTKKKLVNKGANCGRLVFALGELPDGNPDFQPGLILFQRTSQKNSFVRIERVANAF